MLETMAEEGNVGDTWLRKEVLETMAEEGNVGDHG